MKSFVGEFGDIMGMESDLLEVLEFFVFFVWLCKGDYGLKVDFLYMIFLLELFLLLLLFLFELLLLLFVILCEFCGLFMCGFFGGFVLLLCLFLFEFCLFDGDVCL